jgi:hypothetical protein
MNGELSRPFPAGDLRSHDPAWSLHEGGTPDEPISTRRNHAAAAFSGGSGYDNLGLVRMPLTSADAHGLPGAEDLPSMSALEGAVTEAAGDHSVLAVATAGRATFTLLLYTRAGWALHAAIASIEKRLAVAGLEFALVADPGWSHYRRYMALR